MSNARLLDLTLIVARIYVSQTNDNSTCGVVRDLFLENLETKKVRLLYFSHCIEPFSVNAKTPIECE